MRESDNESKGKKENSVGEEQINTPSDSRLLQLLECPVCLEMMSSPIEMCFNGHSICAPCRNRNKFECCPTCRACFTQTRDRTAEQLAELVYLPCENFSGGCLKVFQRRALKSHESICEFRPMNCFIGSIKNCDWKGRVSDVANHFRDKHKVHAIFDSYVHLLLSFSPTAEGITYRILSGYGELFLYCQYVNIKKNEAAYFLMFMGPNNAAELYRYTVHLKSKCTDFAVTFSATAQKYVDNIHAIDSDQALFLEYNIISKGTKNVTNIVEIMKMR